MRLSVDGTRYSQAFRLVKNPQIASSDADLQASTAAQVQIADAISETSHLINTMERWRKQIQDQLAQPRSASASAALEQLDARITGVENELISPEMRLSEAKQFGAPFKVYMNLLWLSGQVGQGVEMAGGGSDYAPTAAQLQLIANLQSQLAQVKSRFTTLETTTIPAFNDKMHGAGISISERLYRPR